MGIDNGLRAILENLGDGMFPLAAWIEEKIRNGRYAPRGRVPWRDGRSSLSVKDTGTVVFFEELLEPSAGELAQAKRFAEVIADPLVHNPLLGDMRDWRAARNLDAVPQFGIVASQNVIATADGRPVTRSDFYTPYWPLVRKAVAAAQPKTSVDWQTLARDLLNDTSVHWPGGQPLKSSPFIKQLGRDFLHGLLNMRNPAADPFRVAFLEEVGEHRRVGNSFTRDDADRLVHAFKERISEH